jgi:hypothetical protein
MNDAVVRLKIVLEHTEPAIWRRIEALAGTTLKDLHNVIQAAMGWQNAHLFLFHVGRQTVGGPGLTNLKGRDGERGVAAGRVCLDDLAARNIKRFQYVYDMGDSWEHDLRIEKVLPADPAVTYPRFIEGAGRCPPEDIGGFPGFYGFLDALEDPENPEHEYLLEWHGGPFDPDALDEDQIRKRLARIADRQKRKTPKPKSRSQ